MFRTLVGVIAGDDSFAWTDGFDAGSVQLADAALPRDLPLLVEHDVDRRAGTVQAIVRARGGAMFAVASLDVEVDPSLWRFLSVGIDARRRSSLFHDRGELVEISLCERTRTIGALPISFHAHDLRDGPGGWSLETGPLDREVLDLASREFARRSETWRPQFQRHIVDLRDLDHVARLRAEREAAAAEAARRAATPRTMTVAGRRVRVDQLPIRIRP